LRFGVYTLFRGCCAMLSQYRYLFWYVLFSGGVGGVRRPCVAHNRPLLNGSERCTGDDSFGLPFPSRPGSMAQRVVYQGLYLHDSEFDPLLSRGSFIAHGCPAL
jgi:hypothetical protein